MTSSTTQAATDNTSATDATTDNTTSNTIIPTDSTTVPTAPTITLTATQQGTYDFLIGMGFEAEQALSTAEVFAGNREGAVNHILNGEAEAIQKNNFELSYAEEQKRQLIEARQKEQRAQAAIEKNYTYRSTNISELIVSGYLRRKRNDNNNNHQQNESKSEESEISEIVENEQLIMSLDLPQVIQLLISSYFPILAVRFIYALKNNNNNNQVQARSRWFSHLAEYKQALKRNQSETETTQPQTETTDINNANVDQETDENKTDENNIVHIPNIDNENKTDDNENEDEADLVSKIFVYESGAITFSQIAKDIEQSLIEKYLEAWNCHAKDKILYENEDWSCHAKYVHLWLRFNQCAFMYRTKARRVTVDNQVIQSQLATAKLNGKLDRWVELTDAPYFGLSINLRTIDTYLAKRNNSEVIEILVELADIDKQGIAAENEILTKYQDYYSSEKLRADHKASREAHSFDYWLYRKSERDWRQFEMGDIIEVEDTQAKWYQVVIRQVIDEPTPATIKIAQEFEDDKKNKKGDEYQPRSTIDETVELETSYIDRIVVVHYMGWNRKWDEPIFANSASIRKVGTHTNDVHRPKTLTCRYYESQIIAPLPL